MDAQADSAGSPSLSMPATASRSPWEHHWASTSVGRRTNILGVMCRMITGIPEPRVNSTDLLALSELQQERGRHSCSSNWYLLTKRWPSARAWLGALERNKKCEYICFLQLKDGGEQSHKRHFHPEAGCCRQSPCHSLCCPPPGNQGSSRTCWRSRQTRVAEHGRAFVRDSPSLSPGHLLYRTRPGQALYSGTKALEY